ncbi:MAG: hypothetical protein ACYDD1_10210 [Caulobacteraceae bacterium]
MVDMNMRHKGAAQNAQRFWMFYPCDDRERRVLCLLAAMSVVGLLAAFPLLLVFG